MRAGAYFTIPENPSDVEQLWREGTALHQSDLPDWMDAKDAGFYRRVYSVPRFSNIPAEAKPAYEAEFKDAEAAGLVLDRSDSRRPHDVYVTRRIDYGRFAIGIYAGSSPFELSAHAGAMNPVLTRDDVTDVSAVMVADPFMVRQDGLWYMFFEVLNWRANKGEIGLATSQDAVAWQYQGIVLAEPFHLSYPYVFEWLGEYYMIPESRQDHSVRLYHGRTFPTGWVCTSSLLSSHDTADTSPFRFDEQWWMFTSSKSDTVSLYGAKDLSGPWREHPSSPIVRSDRRIARPAGRVLVDGNRIIRYAQNCQPAYGSEVAAFEVTQLTSSTYSERPYPCNPVLSGSGTGWNACGMHHADVHRVGEQAWLACVDGWDQQFA
jgi:hypothetical protein